MTSRKPLPRRITLTPKQIAKGWRYHNSGTQPVPDGTKVMFVFVGERAVFDDSSIPAEDVNWNIVGDTFDVAAYRIVR